MESDNNFFHMNTIFILDIYVYLRKKMYESDHILVFLGSLRTAGLKYNYLKKRTPKQIFHVIQKDMGNELVVDYYLLFY